MFATKDNLMEDIDNESMIMMYEEHNGKYISVYQSYWGNSGGNGAWA